MSTLTHKNIVVGITGGIAAYKSIELVRLLTKAGAHVQVVLTQGALAFVTPLTLQAISGHPVRTTLLDPEAEAGMGHIELARWADLIIIAPASADFIARHAMGMADDLLSTVCLATRALILLAPAMNQAMWHHPATQTNIATLQQRGVLTIGPESGVQACGDIGYGRMSEAETIFETLCSLVRAQNHAQSTHQSPPDMDDSRQLAFNLEHPLKDQHWVITAGPTMEAIDPVRFISNHSSGKMGFALAQAAYALGAQVTLISGPVNLAPIRGIEWVPVQSAQDMLAACRLQMATPADVFIGAAAVADFRLKEVAAHKLKKAVNQEEMQLTLIKNPDIIATVAAESLAHFVVGFAAETQNVLAYAQDKLSRKNLDLIIANDVSRRDIGFNQDSNQVHVIGHEFSWTSDKISKSDLANHLVNIIHSQAALRP